MREIHFTYFNRLLGVLLAPSLFLFLQKLKIRLYSLTVNKFHCGPVGKFFSVFKNRQPYLPYP